jgi:hypothetical protein
MTSAPAQRAVSAAMLSLLAFGGCLYLVISRALGPTAHSMPVPVMAAIGMCISLFLHWIFVGLAAQRLGRSVAGWVALTVLLFPIASIVAGILYYWLEDERRQVATGSA